MKLSNLLQLDCREKENKRELNEALHKLPFFSDKEKITIFDVEKAINKIQSKYNIFLGYILCVGAADGRYSLMIKNPETQEHLRTLFAISIYEGLCKVLLFEYAYVKNNYKKDGSNES